MPAKLPKFGTIAELFEHHIDEGNLTPKALGIAGRIQRSNVYRVVRGKAKLDVDELFLLLERLPSVVACDLYSMIPAPDCDQLDVEATPARLLEQITRFNGGTQQRSVEQIVQALADRHLSSAETVQILAALNEHRRGVERAIQILKKLRG